MPKFLLALGDTNELAGKIREAIGVGPYDEVDVQTPQFERTDGRKILYFPTTVAEFDKLKTMTPEILSAFGMARWDENGLWLFPKEWYPYVPDGYEVACIGDAPYPHELFKRGETDDDIRFGCLAFGIVAASAEGETK